MSEMKNDLLNEKIDDLYSNGKLVVKDQGWETKDAYLSLVHVGVSHIGELQNMSWNEFSGAFRDKDTREFLCDYIHKNGGRMSWDPPGRKPAVYPYIEPKK